MRHYHIFHANTDLCFDSKGSVESHDVRWIALMKYLEKSQRTSPLKFIHLWIVYFQFSDDLTFQRRFHFQIDELE